MWACVWASRGIRALAWNGLRVFPRLIHFFSTYDFFSCDDTGEANIFTLVQDDHETVNALYKARSPLAAIDGWEAVTWPTLTHAVVEHNDDGLNLWLRFMTPDRMRELHKLMEQEAA